MFIAAPANRVQRCAPYAADDGDNVELILPEGRCVVVTVQRPVDLQDLIKAGRSVERAANYAFGELVHLFKAAKVLLGPLDRSPGCAGTRQLWSALLFGLRLSFNRRGRI